MMCSTSNLLIVGRRQYSQASFARRRTTSRTSGLCGSCTARRRSTATRCLRPGCREGGIIALERNDPVSWTGAVSYDGPRLLSLPGFTHKRFQSRRVGLYLVPPSERAVDIREDLRPHLLNGDAALRRQLTNVSFVHRPPPRGDECIQLGALLLGEAPVILEIEEFREAATLLRR